MSLLLRLYFASWLKNAFVVACNGGAGSGAGTGEFNDGNDGISIVAIGADCDTIVTDDGAGALTSATDDVADGAELVNLAGAGGTCIMAVGCIATSVGTGAAAGAPCVLSVVDCNISL